MTLCIAAISRRDDPKDERIVTVSDMMLSNEWTGSETPIVKSEAVPNAPRWVRLYAGDPTIDARVLEHLQAGVPKDKEPTSIEVREAFVRALEAEVCRTVENEILSPFGLSREQFVQHGRQYFGDRKFEEMAQQIEDVTLGNTAFLVAGFSGSVEVSLFSIARTAYQKDAVDHDRLGFHAIGSGSTLALAALHATWHPDLTDVEMIYRLCEAKFRSEKASGVGRYTIVQILAPDGTCASAAVERIEELRRIWRTDGSPPPPEKARKLIAEGFRKIDNWGQRPG